MYCHVKFWANREISCSQNFRAVLVIGYIFLMKLVANHMGDTVSIKPSRETAFPALTVCPTYQVHEYCVVQNRLFISRNLLPCFWITVFYHNLLNVNDLKLLLEHLGPFAVV